MVVLGRFFKLHFYPLNVATKLVLLSSLRISSGYV